MSLPQLIDVLTDLKENRKLGSEADEAVRPFQGKNYSSGFSFGSSSRTFANPHDPTFEGGQTVTGEIAGEGLEFSLLLLDDFISTILNPHFRIRIFSLQDGIQ